jgi:glycosyltransferase involved in cell wall biosynthesis
MKKITMLLANAFMPDPRPLWEARSLSGAGYSVKIICWDRGEGLPEKEIVDGISVERIRFKAKRSSAVFKSFYLAMVWPRMFARLAKEDLDIIWCHDLDTLPVGIAFKAFRKKKVVFDSHEVYSKMLYGDIPGWIKRSVGFLERIMVKKADHLIVTCRPMADFYASLGAGNSTVVGNFKDPAVFQIPEETVKKEREVLGITNELVISYIAKLGQDRIIEPLIDAVKADDNVFLIIGGDGYQKPLVEKAARECPRVKYLGYVHNDRIPLYTALADVIYYGFDKNSGMAEFCNPNKLFEALAAGRAFIGGDLGEMGKIIAEEKCGLALGSFDKRSIKNAIDIMKDKDKLRAFKDNARRAGLEKYHWKKAEEALLKAVSYAK